MNELDILKAGRELLSDPNRWTKRTLARDKNGHATNDPWDKVSTCFCSVGAIHKVVGPNNDTNRGLKYAVADCLADSALALFGHRGAVVVFNDAPSTTHDQILAVWDHAIEHYQ